MLDINELKCPECGEKKLGKYGTKWRKFGASRRRVPQYQCRKCGRITINPDVDFR